MLAESPAEAVQVVLDFADRRDDAAGVPGTAAPRRHARRAVGQRPPRRLRGHRAARSPDFGLARAAARTAPSGRRVGVVFSSVCVAMRHFIGDFDPERRRDAIDNVKSQLSVIAELGGAGVVTPAAYGMYTRKLPPFAPPPRTEEEDFDVLVDGTRRARRTRRGRRVCGCCRAAQPLRGPHGQQPRPGRDHRAGRSGIDAVKLVADTYHMNIEEDDPAERGARGG